MNSSILYKHLQLHMNEMHSFASIQNQIIMPQFRIPCQQINTVTEEYHTKPPPMMDVFIIKSVFHEGTVPSQTQQ